ncbi:MAG: ABC transporter ATP-binding protein [Promethearchaeota archaeon]
MRTIKNKKGERGTLRKLFGYFSSNKRTLILTMVFTAMWGVVWSSTPYLTGLAFDVIYESLENLQLINIEVFSYLMLLIFIALIGFFAQGLAFFFVGNLHQGIFKKIREEVFDSLQRQSHKYFGEHSTGELISRSTADIGIVADFFFAIPINGMLMISEFTALLSLLFSINLLIGITCVLFLPIMWFTTRHFKKRYWPSYFDARKQIGMLNKVMQENISGAIVSRVFDARKKDMIRFDRDNSQYRDFMIKAHKYGAAIWPQMLLIGGIMVSIVILLGGTLVMNDAMTPGVLIASIMLSGRLFVPINHITRLGVVLGQGQALGTRIFQVIENVPIVQDNPNAINLPEDGKGEITFEDVSFGYKEEPVLEDITLSIPAGNTVALLGGTGSGKSSLINLIPRFYDVTTGTVKIDGTDVRNLKLESIRNKIGFCDQETFLFSRSIEENIAFGNPLANKEEILQVAKASQIHDFIESLPDGYNTVIGERGVTLSGGQKQRLSIARALLADPLIIIFDDALSSVDIKTERKIQNALEALLKGRTTIFITQRLSTIKFADRIIIMEKGTIAEQGTHTDLLSKNGIYKRLFETQIDGVLDLEILEEVEDET